MPCPFASTDPAAFVLMTDLGSPGANDQLVVRLVDVTAISLRAMTINVHLRGVAQPLTMSFSNVGNALRFFNYFMKPDAEQTIGGSS
jgi:hypothetical protein